MSSQTKFEELKYWVGFNRIHAVGPIRHQKLVKFFGNLKAAWRAPKSLLLRAGMEEKIAREIVDKRQKTDVDYEIEKLRLKNIKLTVFGDDNYPKLLKEIYAPPPLLYYQGELNINNQFPIAVVGSRKISQYGRQVTSQISGQLSQAGITIISGLALGVDACAHQASLDNSGQTVAVLGSGLDKIYPVANQRLAQNIIEEKGCVVSEFPLETPAFKSNFPQRNRIISGLSLGTLVTEAHLKSGALITARHSLEQNREVFAVPGNIYNQNSLGPHDLIKMGAKLVTTAAEILETLHLENAENFQNIKEILPENPTEKTILELVSAEPIHIDNLAKSSKLDIITVNSTLVVLEMKGAIKNIGGQKYIRAR